MSPEPVLPPLGSSSCNTCAKPTLTLSCRDSVRWLNWRLDICLLLVLLLLVLPFYNCYAALASFSRSSSLSLHTVQAPGTSPKRMRAMIQISPSADSLC